MQELHRYHREIPQYLRTQKLLGEALVRQKSHFQELEVVLHVKEGYGRLVEEVERRLEMEDSGPGSFRAGSSSRWLDFGERRSGRGRGWVVLASPMLAFSEA